MKSFFLKRPAQRLLLLKVFSIFIIKYFRSDSVYFLCFAREQFEYSKHEYIKCKNETFLAAIEQNLIFKNAF